jgi:4-amino-4-deoxy-L-arabinose transferase-like glycosyltransferase
VIPPAGALRRMRIVLFALVWFSCAWFGSWEWNPNNAVRLFAAISLVEDGDATIDEYADLTIDKAVFADHVYLDKAPGMTLMALPAVALADAVTGERATALPKIFGGLEMTRYLRLRTRLAVASGPAVLTGLAAVLLFDLALGLTGSIAAALFAALGYALGTPAWGWSTTILGHAPVAALYVIAVWAFWRAATRGAPVWAGVAGLALGWAVVIEYQAVLAGGAITLWMLWQGRAAHRRWQLGAAVVAGGVVALLPLLGYNLVAYGTPFRIAYSGVVGWQGMHQGLFGLGVPRLAALSGITIGTKHGLIWVAPVLLLAIPGLVAWADRRPTRGLAWLAAAVTLIVLLVNAAYVYWEGGNATGPRLAIPLCGMLALGLAPAWVDLGARAARTVAVLLLAVSIAINAMIAAAEIFVPPLYRFPLWSGVYQQHVAVGDLRTIASEYGGWTPWHGFVLWAVLAAAMIGWLVRAATQASPLPRPR